MTRPPAKRSSTPWTVRGWSNARAKRFPKPQGTATNGTDRRTAARAVALCVATTVLVKMGRMRYAWVTILPLTWLAAATLTAGWQKVFSPDPRLGFLSHAQTLVGSANPAAPRLIFNDRLDAALAVFFMAIVLVVIVASAREWYLVAVRRKAPMLHESPYVESRLNVHVGV